MISALSIILYVRLYRGIPAEKRSVPFRATGPGAEGMSRGCVALTDVTLNFINRQKYRINVGMLHIIGKVNKFPFK